jgi:ribose transport system ATP-binding protein
MVGHDLPDRAGARQTTPTETVLSVRNLCAGKSVRNVSFEVRRGEILGIAGLVGSGRTETVRCIFGADPKDSGEILVHGSSVSIDSPTDAVRAGIGLVPEDRKEQGLLLPQPIRVNVTLATLARNASRIGWLNVSSESETAAEFCGQLQVKCSSLEQPVAELSGGNQQKVVISRWLPRDCAVLLFDEPTRGIDAAAKDLVCGLIRDLAARGKAIVLISSELPELMAVSDRIIVLSLGKLAAEFTPADWTQEKITRAAFSEHLAKDASGI